MLENKELIISGQKQPFQPCRTSEIGGADTMKSNDLLSSFLEIRRKILLRSVRILGLSWEEIVVKIKYHSCERAPSLIVNPSTVYEQTEERLKIRLPNGTTIRRTIQRHPKLDAVIYKEGDIVRYFRGTNYPFILSRKGSPAPRICVFCSDVQPYPERNTCDFCGMEVIDPARQK
jgi:hypothetical protein